MRWLTSSSLVAFTQAQTFTNCNPLKDDCPPLNALGGIHLADFTLGENPRFSREDTTGKITYNEEGVNFVLASRGQNPGISSDFYLMFGRIEALVQAAPGSGIVSSLHLLSNDLSEIDFEFIGNDPCRFQTNYFSQGFTGSWDRGGFHNISPPPQKSFHNYTVNWLPEFIEWIVDGEVVRMLYSSDAPHGYPQTPMNIRLGVWAAGDPELNSPGTVEWSGGAVDYNQGPFIYKVKSLKAVDYSSGKLYQYKDKNGSWRSIEAVEGKILSYNTDDGEETVSIDSTCQKCEENKKPPQRHKTDSKNPKKSGWRSLLKPFHF